MKIKYKLSTLVLASAALIVFIASELSVTAHSINAIIKKSGQIEQIDFWVNKLERDFFTYRSFISSDNLRQVQFSLTQLDNALNQPISDAQVALIEINAIRKQLAAIKVLFSGLIQPTTKPLANEMQLHVTQKIIASLQTIREETRILSQTARNDIIDIISEQGTRTIPVLMLSLFTLLAASVYLMRWLHQAITELNKRLDLFNKGEIGHVIHRYHNDEFSDIFDHINAISRNLVETTISRDALQKVVDERTKTLENLANTDPLTQIYTRRVLFQRGCEEFSRANRYGTPLSVIIIDCDYFKRINDTYGHSVGDLVLIHLCRLCEKEIRSVDLFARFGGEEFVVILPETHLNEAHVIAERIKQQTSKQPLIAKGHQINITVSIGIAERSSNDKSFDSLIDRADIALYQAKEHGRNMIKIAQ